MLSLEGNPLVLAPRYSEILKEQLSGLKVIDGNTIFHDRTDDATDKKSKNGSTRSTTNSSKNTLSEIGSSTGDLHMEAWADSVQKFTLDIQFRLLRDVEGGRYLVPEENCNFDAEKLDTIDEEHKSSQYWLTYQDHNGKDVSTGKRSYIQHFQVVDVDGKVTAKSDVDFKLRLEEPPSIEVRDWMYKDLVVNLWESRPRTEKVVEEGSEVEVERVVVNPETELPETETINRGILKVNFIKWLKKSPATAKYETSQKKQQ